MRNAPSEDVAARFFKDDASLRDPFAKELVADALLHGESPDRPSLARFAAASAMALGAVFWSAFRHGDSRRPAHESETWLAAHGEWTNRTRHLLGLAADGDREFPLLVLGRPKSSLKTVETLIGEQVERAKVRLHRPISFRAALNAFPAIRFELKRAWSISQRGNYLPPFGRSVAILFRLCLGQVHREWWRSAGAKPAVVIYGHTGTADASALELEQQESGTTTVHLLHGISTGHAFTGVSDLLIARCGHDAKWHDRLGGYGRASSVTQDRPDLSRSSGKWALCTNYAHPTAFADEPTAVRFENQVIETVASAALRLGKAASDIVYRPHPAIEMLSPGAREEVLANARDAGFASSDTVLDLFIFDLVLTTPSTVMQDGLCAGTIPLVIDLAGADEDSVYGAYPFTCHSEDEVVETVREIQRDREASFRRAWDIVGPGRLPSITEIEALALER